LLVAIYSLLSIVQKKFFLNFVHDLQFKMYSIQRSNLLSYEY